MKNLLQDLRYGLRVLRQNRGFTAVAVLSLALGIGANSAIFSVLNAVMLTSLPVSRPDELFVVWQGAQLPVSQRFSYPMLERLREVMPALTGITGVSRIARIHTIAAGGDQHKEITRVQLVSGEFFAVMGVHPVLGRALTPEDNRRPGEHPVAVISNAYWQRRFGGSPQALGQELSLNGTRFTIVGVGPARFSGVWLEAPAEMWIPLAMQANVSYMQNFSANDAQLDKPWMPQDNIRWLDLIVRAGPEVFDTTAVAVNTSFQQLVAQESESIANPEERRLFLAQRLVLNPFGRGYSNLRDRFATPLFVLMAMVGLLLLIACANTANLLLARAASRQREMAVRLSVGASRRRLVQQLLTESILLTAIAAAAGLVLANWTSELLVRMTLGADAPPVAVDVDGRVLAFTAVIAIATGILFGLAPAFRATKVELAPALQSAAKSVHGGSRFSAAKLLVASQVALSLLLVVGAALFARSLRNLMYLELGFDREHLVSVRISPHLAGYSQEQFPALSERLIERVEAVPGVRSASVAMCGLINGCRVRVDGVIITGYDSRPGEQILIQENRVGANYFSTVGIRLLDGRDFDARDSANSPKVAVVNQAMVRRYFQGRSAIGQRFGDPEPNTEIIGVVEDARVNNVREAAEPMAYYPLQQGFFASSLDVRTSGDPRWVAAEVSRAIRGLEPNLPIETATIRERVESNLNQERVVAQLTSAFGLLALGLACFGLYGVMSYAVARRTSELGLRMALGAPRSHVLWIVFRESLWLVLAGLALGLPLVLAASRLLSNLLFGVSANDPASLIVATLVLMVVAAISGYVPAWRASRVDPLVALRYE